MTTPTRRAVADEPPDCAHCGHGKFLHRIDSRRERSGCTSYRSGAFCRCKRYIEEA